MTENFIFKALFISLAAHTAFICAAYLNRINDIHYKNIHEKRIEISYTPKPHRAVDIKEYPIRPSQRLDLANNQRLFGDGTIPVGLAPERQLPFGMFDESKPEHMNNMELSHKVNIMPTTSEKINNPVYEAYNDMVRERIKEMVYANYDKLQSGTVYLTFLLDDHGVLVESRVVPEKTDAPEHLQEIALKSLQDASPFPPFLKGMGLHEYPFNIEVQYQVSDG